MHRVDAKNVDISYAYTAIHGTATLPAGKTSAAAWRIAASGPQMRLRLPLFVFFFAGEQRVELLLVGVVVEKVVEIVAGLHGLEHASSGAVLRIASKTRSAAAFMARNAESG